MDSHAFQSWNPLGHQEILLKYVWWHNIDDFHSDPVVRYPQPQHQGAMCNVVLKNEQCLELTMNKNMSDDKELAFLPKNNQQPAVD